MADLSNKKIIVPLQDLRLSARSVDGTAIGEYNIRYRVISEDKNTFSEWSPIYKVSSPTISQLRFPNGGSGSINTVYTSTSSVATINWEIPTILSKITEYDVYVKWGTYSGGTVTFPTGAAYEFYGTVPGTSAISIVKPSSKSSFTGANIVVQRTTFPKIVVAGATLFELTNKQF